MKKLLSFILAAVMLLALCACSPDEGKTTGQATADPLTKDDVIQVAIASHASWPYREDWKVWEYIEEGCGATLDVVAYPSSDATTKINLMFAAPDTLTDILYCSSITGAHDIALSGVAVAFDDVEEYMPNFNAWLETLTEDEYNNNVLTHTSHDGKIYYTPVIGREKSQNLRAWLYRKDIFDKHNLKVPETFDELYEVCKQLKALYPESYPFCIRSGLSQIGVTGSSWKPYWEIGAFPIYYDFNAEKWCYGMIEPEMLENIKFYKKLLDEGLINPDFITINASSWQELIATGRGFIAPDYQTRIDFFNSMARVNNPDYDLHVMVPPVATAEGVPMVNKYNLDPAGFQIMNTRDDKRIANAAKYVDWFYSDEAVELVSWGKEGETYEVVDGKKQFITDEKGTQANSLYGFGTYGTFTRMDPESVIAFESEDIAETRDMVLEHTMPYTNPAQWLSFTTEEKKVISDITVELGMYCEEMVVKFILGQEPLSKWDEFVAEVEKMQIDKLLEMYEVAYDRVK